MDPLSGRGLQRRQPVRLLQSPKVAPAIALWRSVEQDRKKGWRLLWAPGPTLLLGAVLRLLTLDQALRAVGAKLGLDVRAVEMANPLAAVDVDKPDDHALVEAILAGAHERPRRSTTWTGP